MSDDVQNRRLIRDPEHWRGRAEEARTIAEHMSDPLARHTMLEVVAGYERLAARVVQKLADEREGLKRAPRPVRSGRD